MNCCGFGKGMALHTLVAASTVLLSDMLLVQQLVCVVSVIWFVLLLGWLPLAWLIFKENDCVRFSSYLNYLEVVNNNFNGHLILLLVLL